MRKFGIFHEHGKVVNSLFGESRRIAEFGSTNCQLEYERSRKFNKREDGQGSGGGGVVING